MALENLVSPAVVSQYEFGGPGSGPRASGMNAEKASAKAAKATDNAMKSGSGNDHNTAVNAHTEAEEAHRTAANSQADAGKKRMHERQAEFHHNAAIDHAYIATKPRAPELSLLAFSGAGAFVPTTGALQGGPNDVTVAKETPNPAGPTALSSVKDVLAAGEYQHPIHGWKLDVTPKSMDKYCAAFDKMSAAGVKVPIYADHKPGAANTLGYCRALFRGGPEALKKFPELAKLPADHAPLDANKLYAIHDWNSPEAMKMGHGVGQVSVLIDKKMKDGTGKEYGAAVRHIAVTPEPIVPGQGAFTQLAASLLNESKTGLYAFAKDATMDDDGDDDYGDHKKAAEKATGKASESGKPNHHMDAAAMHMKAAKEAPSQEESKAHSDCAANHLYRAADALHSTPATAEAKKAQAIKQKNMLSRVENLVSPAVLALSRTEK